MPRINLASVSFPGFLQRRKQPRNWQNALVLSAKLNVSIQVQRTPDDANSVAQDGRFWDFTSDLAKGDTAYTTLALGAHTDNTYYVRVIVLNERRLMKTLAPFTLDRSFWSSIISFTLTHRWQRWGHAACRWVLRCSYFEGTPPRVLRDPIQSSCSCSRRRRSFFHLSPKPAFWLSRSRT